MNNRYIVVQNIYEFCNFSQISFGIAYVVQDENSIVVLQSISDIVSDRKHIEKLVDLCNKCKLDPVHMADVVEDFLIEGLF